MVLQWLGKQSFLDDLASLDPELYNGLIFLKNYTGNPEDLSLNFAVATEGPLDLLILLSSTDTAFRIRCHEERTAYPERGSDSRHEGEPATVHLPRLALSPHKADQGTI